jgi:hypothetical protein
MPRKVITFSWETKLWRKAVDCHAAGDVAGARKITAKLLKMRDAMTDLRLQTPTANYELQSTKAVGTPPL